MMMLQFLNLFNSISVISGWYGSVIMMGLVLQCSEVFFHLGQPENNDKIFRQIAAGLLQTLSCETMFKRWLATWYLQMSLCMTKPTKSPVCPAKTRISLHIRPVWSVFAVHSRTQGFFMQTVKTDQTRGCPGWSESLLGAQVILLVLSCCGSYGIYKWVWYSNNIFPWETFLERSGKEVSNWYQNPLRWNYRGK